MVDNEPGTTHKFYLRNNRGLCSLVKYVSWLANIGARASIAPLIELFYG